MPARAGLAPWNEYKAVSGQLNSKSTITSGNMEWDLSTGWHPRRQEGWNRKKSTRGHKRTLRGIDGQEYDVYSYAQVDEPKNSKMYGQMHGMYSDYIGFHAGNNEALTQERLDYAIKAFEDKNNHIEDHEGAGHIARIQYAVREQILRVTFSNNGSIALFFRVPTAVAGELLHYAQGKNSPRAFSPSTGDMRHILGMRFWDYVRIRGVPHGARYPWEYEKHVEGVLTNSKKRHVIPMSVSNAYKLGLISKERIQQMYGIEDPENSRDTISVVTSVSDEDLMKYYNELVLRDKETLMQNLYKQSQETNKIVRKNKEGKTISTDYVQTDKAKAAIKALAKMNPEASALSEYTQGAFEKMQDRLIEFRNVPTNMRELDRLRRMFEAAEGATDEGLSSHAELRAQAALMDRASKELQSVYSKRTGQIKGGLDYETAKLLVRAAEGGGAIRTWVKENFPAQYERVYSGRVWTPQQLTEFANPTVPGHISQADASAYKLFIKAKDWQGALNYLQTHSDNLVYQNEKTGEIKSLGRMTYASSRDVLGTDVE